MPQVLRMMKAIFSGVQSDGGDDQVALVLAVVVIRDDDDFTAGESLDGFGDGVGHGASWRMGQEIVGVTAPRVSRAISCAVSRDIQAWSELQSWVIAPGVTPIRRANSTRDMRLRESQSASFMTAGLANCGDFSKTKIWTQACRVA